MINIHHKVELPSLPKKLTKHSIAHLTSPGSDCENGSDGGPSSPKKPREGPEKIVSYTEMIAKAIFASPDNKSTLAEIYSFLIVKYPILKSRGKSWKNSVRHTLSLNEWFVKIPKLDNAKCCYWSIHPYYIQRFRRGDFQKQRKASVMKMRTYNQSQQRCFDLGYDVSPATDYHHFMNAPYFQQDPPSGISSNGSFSSWPVHRQYDVLQPNFYPQSSNHYSPFPMYNLPPHSFPPMYSESDPQQYENLSPTIKGSLQTTDRYAPQDNELMQQSYRDQYDSVYENNEYYTGKQENNQQKQLAMNNTQSQHPDSSSLHEPQLNNTLNLLSNAAMSVQYAMNNHNINTNIMPSHQHQQQQQQQQQQQETTSLHIQQQRFNVEHKQQNAIMEPVENKQSDATHQTTENSNEEIQTHIKENIDINSQQHTINTTSQDFETSADKCRTNIGDVQHKLSPMADYSFNISLSKEGSDVVTPSENTSSTEEDEDNDEINVL